MCSLLRLFHISYYDWGQENRSLYRGLRYIEVRQIEVPLQLSALILSEIKNNHNILDGVFRGGGVGWGGGLALRNCFRKHGVQVSAPYRLRMALVRITCWTAVRKRFCCLMKYLQYNDDKYCTDSIYFLPLGVLAYWWARVLQFFFFFFCRKHHQDHQVFFVSVA